MVAIDVSTSIISFQVVAITMAIASNTTERSITTRRVGGARVDGGGQHGRGGRHHHVHVLVLFVELLGLLLGREDQLGRVVGDEVEDVGLVHPGGEDVGGRRGRLLFVVDTTAVLKKFLRDRLKNYCTHQL